ncbi:MAG: type II toxin-antitoxin system RelE/ParE family toxin [Rhodoglobus sp.]
MIRSFRHKGLGRFFETGSKAGIQPAHADRLQKQLTVLNQARSVADIPAAWRPHRLEGRNEAGGLGGHHAIWVSASWRLTFLFEGHDIHLLDYLDYH